MLLPNLLLFMFGLLVLYFGAEWLVKGAAGLALRYGIRPLVVGITVVALATSMPEFVVNIMAAVSGEDSMALGNIVGSNICNIALILGTSAIVLPLTVTPGTLKKEYPIMIAVMLLFYGLSLDGLISQVDGIILVLGLFLFLTYLIVDARAQSRTNPAPPGASRPPTGPAWRKVVFILAGMIGLSVGARLMVDAAVSIAALWQVDPVIVGLTVVAIGTSLPELAASVASVVNEESDMSVGNVLGSNLLNVLFVVGLVALFKPLRVDAQSLSIHFPVMIGFSVLLLPLAWTQFRITRVEGGVLVLGFLGYLAYLVIPHV